MAKKKYFAHNWQEFKDSDDSMFHPHTFEELMSWKVAGWQIPSSVCCIIRETDLDTKKTKEHVYSKPAYAKKKIMSLIDKGNLQITVCEENDIHYLLPEEFFDEHYEEQDV